MGLMDTVASHYPPAAMKAAAREDGPARIEIRAYIAPPEDLKWLREDEKRVAAERKRIKSILDNWDPMMISAKARRDFTEQLTQTNMRLRDIRKRLGK